MNQSYQTRLERLLIDLLNKYELQRTSKPTTVKEFIEEPAQAITSLFLELVGEEDHSPMYFAELYEGQARDASKKRDGRNEHIAEIRKAMQE